MHTPIQTIRAVTNFFKPPEGGGASGRRRVRIRYFDSDFSFEEHASNCVRMCCRHLLAASSVDDNDVKDYYDGESLSLLLLPPSQSRFWDAFHARHLSGTFYRPRRYLLEAFPCIAGYLLADEDDDYNGDCCEREAEESDMEERRLGDNDSGRDSCGDGSGEGGEGGGWDGRTREDDRVILEIGCGSGSSCVLIIQRHREAMVQEGTGCDGAAARPGRQRRRRPRRTVLLACDSSRVAVDTT